MTEKVHTSDVFEFTKTLLDEDGNAKDLTDAVTISLIYSIYHINTETTVGMSVVGDPLGGTVTAMLTLTQYGRLRYTIRVTFADGTVRDYPTNGYGWLLVQPSLDD